MTLNMTDLAAGGEAIVKRHFDREARFAPSASSGQPTLTVRASQTATQTRDYALADYLGVDPTAYRCLDILDARGRADVRISFDAVVFHTDNDHHADRPALTHGWAYRA
jgi:hypothetical protein